MDSDTIQLIHSIPNFNKQMTIHDIQKEILNVLKPKKYISVFNNQKLLYCFKPHLISMPRFEEFHFLKEVLNAMSSEEFEKRWEIFSSKNLI